MEMQGKIVLAVGAHADDLEFFAGGTIAKYKSLGAKIYYVIVTDGSKGSEDYTLKSSELILIRQEEQRNAAEILGVTEVAFLSFVDGELENTLELRKKLVKIVRTIQPNIVISFDPAYLYDASWGMVNHPDHRATGQAVLDAVFPFSRNRRTFPELFEQGNDVHSVSQLLLINLKQHDYYEDISSVIDLKIKALSAHVSQKDNNEAVIEQMKQLCSRNTTEKYEECFVKIDIE